MFVTLILAYFLSPEDFGLVAMMAVFIGIAMSLMDSGFRQALIRIPDATQLDFNTAFYANIVLGIISYGLLFLAAPLIAGFYDEVRLVALIRVAGLLVIINAFQVVQFACLGRALNFKAQFQSALPAAVISAFVAVILAYFGFGVWALVAQMVVSACFAGVFLWLKNNWRPSFNWSASSFKAMHEFGFKLFLADLLDIVFRNLYVIVIAKYFSVTVAGLYFFADKIRDLVVLRLVESIQNVTYPALVKVGSSDENLKSGYKNLIIVTSFILSPFVLLIAALAEPIFNLLLDERWLQASQYLELMCIAGVLLPVSALNLNILKVKGRSDLSLKIELIKKLLQVLILAVSINYGVEGILYGQIIGSVLALGLNSYFSGVLIDYSLVEQSYDFMPNFLLSGLMALLMYGACQLEFLSDLTTVLLLGPLAIIFYLSTAYLFRLKGANLCSDLLNKRLLNK